MFGKLGAPEIVLILVVVILIFGAKRLPDMARSLGQSMRIIKSETKAMRDHDEENSAAAAPAASADSTHRIASERPLNAVPAVQEATDTAPAQNFAVPR
ncbi:Sec-independent protein translocase subunit TatA [Streptomyces sp. 142MFCol3.1]|uniref:Sec-independent protein translocase subunit TatA n=1 Tax=Streptomyces sp. 142MFCol3.1 TaxID=1172179 RepID=UPI00041B8735|nr:Sec-independent protein translocase subunit TatA [Streptomyces sp. 142MFCol3.1]